MTSKDIEQQAHQRFHFRSPPPLCDWLAHTQSASDQKRLHAVGNVVIPRCASLAMHVIGRTAPRL